MFGRTVSVDGKEYFVFCCPETPHSEILMRAIRMAERDEAEARAKHPDHIAYRRMLNSVREACE